MYYYVVSYVYLVHVLLCSSGRVQKNLVTLAVEKIRVKLFAKYELKKKKKRMLSGGGCGRRGNINYGIKGAVLFTPCAIVLAFRTNHPLAFCTLLMRYSYR